METSPTSIAQWETEEPEYEVTQFLVKLPRWMKTTTEYIAGKFDISVAEFYRRSVILQTYYELSTRDLLVVNEHESVEQAVLRFYKSTLKEHDSSVTTTEQSS